MQHVRLGRTGLQVSRICLGTMTFGLQVDESGSRAILDHAAELGITFLDTADVYPLGGDLTTVGPHRGDRRPLAARASATSTSSRRSASRRWAAAVGHGQQPPPHHGRDRRVAAPAADRLRRPVPTALRRPERAARRVARRARRSRARRARSATSAARTSSRTGSRTRSAAARRSASPRFDSVQPRYNLLFREFERELFPLCLDEGVGVIPYNPIAGGMLSGKHDRTKPPEEGTRFTLGNAGAARTRTATGTTTCSTPSTSS